MPTLDDLIALLHAADRSVEDACRMRDMLGDAPEPAQLNAYRYAARSAVAKSAYIIEALRQHLNRIGSVAH